MLVCPVCRAPLSRKGVSLPGAYCCGNGHSFDVSSKGYLNLLMPKSSGGHGDSRAMLEARRRFLDAGYYSPLRDKIVSALTRQMTPGIPFSIVDCGCGEGYYTAGILKAAESICPEAGLTAVDVSRDACAMTASRLSRKRVTESDFINVVTASSYDLPLSDASCDAVICVFSPAVPSEFARCLKKNCTLIYVIPGEDHLIELKEKVYELPYRNTPGDFRMEGFSLLSADRVSFDMDMRTEADISDLFSMTPYSMKTGSEGEAKLLSAGTFCITADFYLLVYVKNIP